MNTTSLSSATLRDKILGCWFGKNSGGTLGAPLEKGFGEPEPFNIDWYPKLEPGGIPNDDLEMQLIWLLALEEVGPSLTADDLVHYWLNHVGYNFDEYGFAKTNFRLGLRPPVAAAHNNCFVDAMGCPIRSELWACVAPGYPRLAVRYAYEDGSTDHAGGEGLYGEYFNAAVQAAAFIISDPLTLINIGLTYVPAGSKTDAAIRAALKAHADGEDWKQARRRVLAAAPHFSAQYAPPNMGFQVIGWLYGKDYADALCTAVNCGYDTDCTGATLGAFLGIVHGHKALPAKWLEPLGTAIATSAPWGGLRNFDGRFPADILNLTDRTVALAARVLKHHGLSLDAIPCDVADLEADDASRELWRRNPWQLDYRSNTVSVGIEYPKTAAIAPHTEKTIRAHITNHQSVPLTVSAEMSNTGAITSLTAKQELELAPRATVSIPWRLRAGDDLAPGNRNDLQIQVAGRPALPSVPVVLLATTRWRFLENYPADGETDDRKLFDTAYAPEQPAGDLLTVSARPGVWNTADAETNAIPFAAPLTASGVTYAQTFTHSPRARQVRLGVPANTAVKIWLNGHLVSSSYHYRPHRPNYGGAYDGQPEPYVNTELRAGWNEIFIKFVRGAAPLPPDNPVMAASLVLSDPTDSLAGLTDQIRSRLPWEEPVNK